MPSTISKANLFIQQYLDENGKSNMIDRYKLPTPFAYTSGDGIFRSDGELGLKYKFVRFHKNWKLKNITKLSCCWRNNITSEEKEQLECDFKELTFPEKAGVAVHFIRFYGKSESPIHDEGIRKDIRDYITSLPCAVCRRTDTIECDHKNDLYKLTDPRLLIKTEQQIDDFQPLCKHCNDKKRSENSARIKKVFEKNGIWKRQPSPFPNAPFLPGTGGDTLDINNPKWYIGTYWGDVAAFHASFSFK